MADHREVYKFGGASVRDAAAIRNVANIIAEAPTQQLVVVVSAMGKTTNALEEVVSAFAKTEIDAALQHLTTVKAAHYEVARELFGEEHPAYAALNDAFVEVEWLLEEPYDNKYDYVYDQVVSIGEIASSILVAACLNADGKRPTTWLDARGLIRTDERFREATVEWPATRRQVEAQLLPALGAGGTVLTQGFIGSSADNETTTLGREGSDYSAAVFAHCVDAACMSIWKDVPGVLTADPRYFDDVTKLDRLSYREAIEMTYYGAKVIHPKTIKPLQNKSIPLHVRSFIDPTGAGTVVSAEAPKAYPPIITVEREQALVEIQTRDFSFVAEHHLRDLFASVAEHRLRLTMMQNSAISFSIAVADDEPGRVDGFVEALAATFSCELTRGLEVCTVRHADDDALAAQRAGKLVLMDKRAGSTVQMVTQARIVPRPRA